jgi:hypothetical protein
LCAAVNNKGFRDNTQFTLSVPTKYNKNQFIVNSEVHNYATRQHTNFHLPSVSLTKCEKGIGYLGVKVFNKLPQYLKEEFDNLNKFKQLQKLSEYQNIVFIARVF